MHALHSVGRLTERRVPQTRLNSRSTGAVGGPHEPARIGSGETKKAA